MHDGETYLHWFWIIPNKLTVSLVFPNVPCFYNLGMTREKVISLKNCNSFYILFDLVSSVVVFENQYKITNFI
jgi:hypothetical protein